MGKDKELRKIVDIREETFKKHILILDEQKINKKDLVECEKCKCLLKKESAIRGKSEVREREKTDSIAVSIDWNNGTVKYPQEEYIYTPYFCRRCGKK